MSLRSIAAVPVLLLPLILTACGGDDSTTATDDVETTQCDYAEDGTPPSKEVDLPDSEAPAAGETPVTLETSAGTFDLTLDAAAAPCTVNSFISIADQG